MKGEIKMQPIYPKGTPVNVQKGKSYFVNKELLIRAINEAGMNGKYVSTHVFKDRGKRHAPNKVNEWIKYRYPAKVEDLKLVWNFIDPIHKYDWRDFCFTDYQSSEFKKILFIYRSYAVRKVEQTKDARSRKILGKGSAVAVQTKLF